MVNSYSEDKTKNTSSRRSGSSRASRKSHRSSSRKSSTDGGGSSKGGSRSPNRSSEPRRSKRSKEDLEAKEKARAERPSGNNNATAELLAAVDHTGAVVEQAAPRSSRNKQRNSSHRRRSQQDRGVVKDAVTKAKDLLNNRSNEANAGPSPGAHADSRGDEVAKDQKSGKGRFSRPLGTQSVFTITEEGARMEAEKGQEQGGLLVASAVDESHDPDLAMALLNSMLDQQIDESDNAKKSTKNTENTPDNKTKKSGDSNEESKEEENEGSDGTDWENTKLKKGVQFFRFLCCTIVLGAAGIGTWIALRENNNLMSADIKDPSSGGARNVTTGSDAVPSNSTDDPISTANPSSPISATSAPSGPPNSNTGISVTFEPPSEEDCTAVTNGGTIQGQDTMPTQSYLLDLDAMPFFPMDLIISAGIIEDKLRELLASEITGCNDPDHAETNNSFSYAIGNVMVDAFGVEGVSCRDGSHQCHRVRVAMDIVVRDDTVKVATVITELSLFFGGGILASKLELTELYESITVVTLGSTEQDKSPSIPDNTSPSMEPSIAPSKAPSVVSSPTLLETPPMLTARPTRGPSTSISTPLPTSAPAIQDTTPSPTNTSSPPTPGPSPPPTPQPAPQGTSPTSPPPTSRPTPFPTPRPAALPTFPPTVTDPTSPPSTSPTEMPSTSPTNAPVAKSPFPSATPTEAPSANPSKTPSSSPTPGPSRAPSSQPSPNPTSGPTNRPSTSPSYQPSTAPSLAPVSPISLSTNRCAYLESVLGNRASLHQLAFDWMCNVDTWEPSEVESYQEQWHDRYAVVAYVYAELNDDPDTFNHSILSGASTQSTCVWLRELHQIGYTHHVRPSTCLQTAVGSKVRALGGYAGLHIADPYSGGYLPSAIGLLTNLEQLHYMLIDRQLPSELGLLTALTSLYFVKQSSNANSESRTIPTEVGLLTNLEFFLGRGCGFTGTIPSGLMSLTALKWLYLDNNQISGTIPPSIVGLTAILTLEFRNNKLTGTIPSELMRLTTLNSLDFSDNQLDGAIPPQSINWLPDLVEMQFWSNKLTGTIPSELMSLTKLRTLNLGVNQLTGTIPPSIIGLTNLDYLYFHSNMLTGTVPPLPYNYYPGWCRIMSNTFDDVTNGVSAGCYV